jgi:protein SDA1
MKEASLSVNHKVISGGVRFFLGVDQEREDLENESDNEEGPDLGRVKHQLQINKTKRSTKHKKLEKAQEQLKRVYSSPNSCHPY